MICGGPIAVAAVGSLLAIYGIYKVFYEPAAQNKRASLLKMFHPDWERDVRSLRRDFNSKKDSLSKDFKAALEFRLNQLKSSQKERVIRVSITEKEILERMGWNGSIYAMDGNAEESEARVENFLRDLFGGKFHTTLLPVEMDLLSKRFEVKELEVDSEQEDLESLKALIDLSHIFGANVKGEPSPLLQMAPALEKAFDEGVALVVWAKRMAEQPARDLSSLGDSPEVIDVTILKEIEQSQEKKYVLDIIGRLIESESMERFAFLAHDQTSADIIDNLKRELGESYEKLRGRINGNTIRVLGNRENGKSPDKLEMKWVYNQLKDWAGSNITVITDDVDRWQADPAYEKYVTLFELVKGAQLKEVISLNAVAEEVHKKRILLIQA